MDEHVQGRSPDAADAGEAPVQRRSAGSVVVVLAGLAGVAVVLSLVFSGDAVRSGEQVVSPELRFVAAPEDGWVLLVAPGEPRPDFPEPMIRLSDETMCFGFSRTDFDETRPSLARCRDSLELSEEALVLLARVTSGADEWHVLVFGSEIVGVDVEFEDGGALPADRVHVAGTAVALRIPSDRVASSIRWESSLATYGCTPDATAVQTGLWCAEPAAGREPDGTP